VGGVSSFCATAALRSAAISPRAGGVISSTLFALSRTTSPGAVLSSGRRAASNRSEVRIPSATVAVILASASLSSALKSCLSSRLAR
jgi:hypothetical protein